MYEYHFEKINVKYGIGQERINELGKEGWQLVTTVPTSEMVYKVIGIFIRSIGE